jgi:hypothetical protein
MTVSRADDAKKYKRYAYGPEDNPKHGFVADRVYGPYFVNE